MEGREGLPVQTRIEGATWSTAMPPTLNRNCVPRVTVSLYEFFALLLRSGRLYLNGGMQSIPPILAVMRGRARPTSSSSVIDAGPDRGRNVGAGRDGESVAARCRVFGVCRH